jgi:hypothetical protein
MRVCAASSDRARDKVGREDWGSGAKPSAGRQRLSHTLLFVLVRLSDHRRLALVVPLIVILIFLVFIIVIIGISRRRRWK